MKADLMQAWLFQEGYWNEIDKDGDVHFKYDGKHMYFTPDDDPTFFRLSMPGIYKLENNRVKVLEACNTINRNYKVLKAFLNNDSLWLSIEVFVDSTPEVGDFADRCCKILVNGFNDIAKEIFDDK